MSRKPKKGYFVRGQFVAEGSELDLELKRELKGSDEASKTELKSESAELQKLGEALLDAARRPDGAAWTWPKSWSTRSPKPSASPTSRAGAARCSSSAS